MPMPKKRKKEKKMEATSSNATFAIFAKADMVMKSIAKSQRILLCALFERTISIRCVARRMASLNKWRHSLALAVLTCRLTYCTKRN